MLKKGANVNAKDKRNEDTPLHYCSMSIKTDEQMNVVDELIKWGADVSLKNKVFVWIIFDTNRMETVLFT